jgi:hypothetical protein
MAFAVSTPATAAEELSLFDLLWVGAIPVLLVLLEDVDIDTDAVVVVFVVLTAAFPKGRWWCPRVEDEESGTE